jgi:hypothetical protein
VRRAGAGRAGLLVVAQWSTGQSAVVAAATHAAARSAVTEVKGGSLLGDNGHGRTGGYLEEVHPLVKTGRHAGMSSRRQRYRRVRCR